MVHGPAHTPHSDNLHGDDPHGDDLPEQYVPAPAAVRDGWNEEEHTRVDYAECTDANCMNVNVNVGFQGMTEVDYTWTPTFLGPERGNQSVGDDVRSAWQTQLEREGKHSTGGTSLRDVIFGDASRPD